jgi:hypothetical protein
VKKENTRSNLLLIHLFINSSKTSCDSASALDSRPFYKNFALTKKDLFLQYKINQHNNISFIKKNALLIKNYTYKMIIVNIK